MVLDNIPDPLSDFSDFSSSSSSDTPDLSPNPYPQPTPLAPFSALFGYTENDRQRYIRVQTETTERLLDLQLTAHERGALAYYDSIFYTYESYGDTFGTSAGLSVGYMLRQRKPGLITNGVARLFSQGGNPKAVKLIGTGLKLLTFSVVGRMYGITSAGLRALNRMRAEQKVDPVMARIVKARAAKLGAPERRGVAPTTTTYPARRNEDEQSLSGGVEIADQGEETQDQTFPFGRPSEKIVQLVREEPRDPFSFDDEKHEGARQTAWKNTHSSTAETAWERLRRGQIPPDDAAPASSPRAETPRSSWPPGAPGRGAGESQTDGFGFSGERELARAQAQKEFDESVERERRSAGGDAYGGGGKRGGEWGD